MGTSLLRNYVNTSEGKTFVNGHGISEWERRLCEKLREIERLFSYAREGFWGPLILVPSLVWGF
ncbi:hypothetical protein [Stygiolobus azoricus]|uniref:Uncharacterized protein n=1 Tax=Stygiolobus azoricus TaxID=41675 RepID=A0A650CQE5_9CREN|nr:hypothetical protein [Stygiolobus azoricus]QGR19697.1 hypothetical protein D1868_06600 [Stygiolobus azoricus]